MEEIEETLSLEYTGHRCPKCDTESLRVEDATIVDPATGAGTASLRCMRCSAETLIEFTVFATGAPTW